MLTSTKQKSFIVEGNMNTAWKIQAWMYKKAPRLLTFLEQFTIIEWFVIILLIEWLI